MVALRYFFFAIVEQHLTSAAKAATRDYRTIAALKRCAAQKQRRSLTLGAKAHIFYGLEWHG